MQEKAERQQRCQAVEKLRETLDEKYLWEVILLYAGESFKTYTGLLPNTIPQKAQFLQDMRGNRKLCV